MWKTDKINLIGIASFLRLILRAYNLYHTAYNFHVMKAS